MHTLTFLHAFWRINSCFKAIIGWIGIFFLVINTTIKTFWFCRYVWVLVQNVSNSIDDLLLATKEVTLKTMNQCSLKTRTNQKHFAQYTFSIALKPASNYNLSNPFYNLTIRFFSYLLEIDNLRNEK